MNRKREAGLPLVGNLAGTMSDSYEMLRKIWSVSGLPSLPTPAGVAQFANALPQALPSMIVPTLDVEELDRRITDLRVVEQWLELNASMLRTAIQSLEVQRNTIATVKSFGGAMMNLSKPAASSGAPLPVRAAAPPPMPSMPSMPSMPPASPSPPPPMQAPVNAPPVRHRRRSKKHVPAATSHLPLNPAAWWGALQDQFSKVAAAAAAEAAAETKKTAPAAKKKPVRRAGRAKAEKG